MISGKLVTRLRIWGEGIEPPTLPCAWGCSTDELRAFRTRHQLGCEAGYERGWSGVALSQNNG